jgi:hypothetical protein
MARGKKRYGRSKEQTGVYLHMHLTRYNMVRVGKLRFLWQRKLMDNGEDVKWDWKALLILLGRNYTCVQNP